LKTTSLNQLELKRNFKKRSLFWKLIIENNAKQ